MKIKEICEYGKKSNIKAGEGLIEGNVKFFTSSSESSKYTNEEQFTTPGIIMGTGGNATLHYCDEPFSVSTDCIVLFPKIKVSPKYLYYFFKGNFHVLQSGFKGAGLKHTSKKYIDEISLNHIPNNDEQVKIVNILDKVNDIIFKKNQQLSEYDQLIKSRFVEMFGNPYSNNKGWNTLKLFEVVTEDCSLSYGIVKTGDDIKDGIPVFRPVDITRGSVPRLATMKKTTQEISDQYKRTILKGRELLITVRANIGETYIIDETFKNCNVGRGIVPIRTREEVIQLDFLKYQLDNEYMNREIKAKSKGITLKGFNISDLKDITLIVPPLPLQKDFKDFVQQADKLKFAVQQSLNETQQLFDSLMQKYFG